MRDRLKEKINQIKIESKNIYLATCPEADETEDAFLDKIASELENGAEIIQIKSGNLPAKTFLTLAKKVKQLCIQYEATFIINDRLDIAFLVESDGVHLEQDGLDVKSAREILGSQAIIGVSTHTQEEENDAIQAGADYIIIESKTDITRNSTQLIIKHIKSSQKDSAIQIFIIDKTNQENYK